MAKCEFAVWMPLPWSGGTYVKSPPKIVHHTTEGATAQSAFDTYKKRHDIPHFTVDSTHIYQHLDTSVAATALKHDHGTVETNRSSAIQYELVGFAGRPKDRQALLNAGRLCRWIEHVHDVEAVWPSGYPDPPRDGGDPGQHNRSEENWTTKSGHYGHCHVPGNIHWDPAYCQEEVELIMSVSSPDFRILETSLSLDVAQDATSASGETLTQAAGMRDTDLFSIVLNNLVKNSESTPNFGGFFPSGIGYLEVSISPASGLRVIVSGQPSTPKQAVPLADSVENSIRPVDQMLSQVATVLVDRPAKPSIPGTDYPEWALARDLKLAQEHYWTFIVDAVQAENLDLEVVIGIGSKESQWGVALRPPGPSGTGDWTPRDPAKWGVAMPTDGKGWGRGLMQIDWHSDPFAKSGPWYEPETNIKHGCQVLRQKIDAFIAEGKSAAVALKLGISAYNGSAGVNSAYCKDVMARADWIKKQL